MATPVAAVAAAVHRAGRTPIGERVRRRGSTTGPIGSSRISKEEVLTAARRITISVVRLRDHPPPVLVRTKIQVSLWRATRRSIRGGPKHFCHRCGAPPEYARTRGRPRAADAPTHDRFVLVTGIAGRHLTREPAVRA